MEKLPIIAAVATAMWVFRHLQKVEEAIVYLPNPKSRLLSWTCASDLTAVNETKSTASVVIPITTMTIGVIGTGMIVPTVRAA